MEEIIALLLADTDLEALLGGKKIYPFGLGSTLEECVLYEFYTMSDNGKKVVEAFNVKVVAYNLDKALALQECIKGIILTLGDAHLTLKVLKVEQNGGSSMSNVVNGKPIFHFGMNFNIVRRK